MKRKIALLLLIQMLAIQLGTAQKRTKVQDEAQVTISISQYKQLESRADSIKWLRPKLDSILTSTQHTRHQLSKACKQRYGDSLTIQDLQEEVRCLKETQDQYYREIVSLDTLRVKESSLRLYHPYKSNTITQSIHYFNGIHNTLYKTEYHDILFWLNHYEFYFNEIKELLSKLQNAPLRTDIIRSCRWKETALNSIQNTPYYIEKQKHEEWSIPFLNNTLTEVENRIKKSKDSEIVDLSDIIERFGK